MKQKDMIVIIAVAAGGYLVYTYLKQQGMLPEWLGGEAAPAGGTGGTGSGTGTGAGAGAGTSAGGGGGTGTGTEINPPVNTLRAELLAAANGNPYLIDGKMNGHQWNYYRNQLRPPALSADDMFKAFPDGAGENQMTVDEFLGAIHGAGLAGIVPANPVPSMTFGGNLGNYGMAPRRNRGWVQ